MAAPAPTTFDTLSAARELEAAGLERRQAEAIADRDTLATKADVAAVKADVEKVSSRLTALSWVLGFVATAQLAMLAKVFGIV